MRSRTIVYQERWRYWVTLLFIVIIFAALTIRVVQLMVIDRKFLQKQGNARSLRVLTLPASRGMITDRNGYPLAISSPVDSLWVNPKAFDFQHAAVPSLARLLGETQTHLLDHIKGNQEKEFIYLKRHISPTLSQQIAELNLPGVNLQKEYRRYYPESEVTSHVVGFTNIDEHGQEGMELHFNDYLKGHAGKQKVIKDRLGHTIEVIDNMEPAIAGHDVALSIDHRIQYLAYKTLKDAVNKSHAESGSMVILDVNSGEILAMVNQPSYNPNNRSKNPVDHYRNRAVTDLFEPGSTIKGLSVANILENSQLTPDSVVDTSPGWIALNGHVVDDHRDNGVMSLTRVLQRSSNVGMTKFTLLVPPDSLWQMLHRLGFGEKTQADFPGEATGRLEHHRLWAPFTLATLSFGYGVSASALQLAKAYSAIAAGGIKRDVSLIKLDTAKPGTRVMKAATAQQTMNMLETVVAKGGTGTLAQIRGYRVAGKTGTVRKITAKGYDHHHHLGIFVGAVPASNPQLVAVVVINDPAVGSYYGGSVAAPVFAKVMSGALRMLSIPPDGVHG